MASQWFYTLNRRQQGPVSFAELSRLADEGILRPADLVWQEGMADWIKAGALDGLFEVSSLHDSPQRSDRIPATYAEEESSRRRPPFSSGVATLVEEDLDLPNDTGMPVGLKAGAIVATATAVLLVLGVGLFFLLRSQSPLYVPSGQKGLIINKVLVDSDPRDQQDRTYQEIVVRLVSNKVYRFYLESPDFNPLLHVVDERLKIHGFDPGEGEPQQKVTLRFSPPQSGIFRVVITAKNDGGPRTGAYKLVIREENRFIGE